MLKNSFKFGVRSSEFGVGGKRIVCLLLTAVCLLLLAGCRYDMQDQPKYKAYRKSDFFKDGSSARPLIEGTVARGFLREDKALYTGKKDGATVAPSADPNAIGTAKYPNEVTEFPFPVTEEVIARGKRQFQIFCSVCHGPTGNGDGMIVRRGFKQPPSYHIDDLRQAPVGHLYDVATNGWGVMKGYAAQTTVSDRWAIVAYIRVLQAAQNLEQKPAEGTQPPASATPTPTPQRAGGPR